MGEEDLKKVIKPVQGETFQRSFNNSNNLKPISPAQTTSNSNKSGNCNKEN